MGVNTAMLNPPGGGGDSIEALGGNVVKAAGDVLEPDQVAEVVVQAIADERFLILPHPEVAHVLPAQGQRLRPLAGRHAPAAGPRRRG